VSTDVGRKRYRCWKEEIPMLEGRDTDVGRKRFKHKTTFKIPRVKVTKDI
jgi:hypothetical protein